jgi:hypothetical protein
MMRRTVLFVFVCFINVILFAQENLPVIKLAALGGNKVQISWVNPYGSNTRQLSIQRSTDPYLRFSSILTLPDPTLPENGFVDAKAPSAQCYYRIYVLLDGGKYVFSKTEKLGAKNEAAKNSVQSPTGVTAERKIIYIKKQNAIIAQLPEAFIKPYKDSIAYSTKDTLQYNTADTLVIKPYISKESFKPSSYVFTAKQGIIKILLPDAATKKYSIKFFDESNHLDFEIKQITAAYVTLDKANFIHAGWFNFELYEDGQLKEKNKLYVAKEF